MGPISKHFDTQFKQWVRHSHRALRKPAQELRDKIIARRTRGTGSNQQPLAPYAPSTRKRKGFSRPNMTESGDTNRAFKVRKKGENGVTIGPTTTKARRNERRHAEGHGRLPIRITMTPTRRETADFVKKYGLRVDTFRPQSRRFVRRIEIMT